MTTDRVTDPAGRHRARPRPRGLLIAAVALVLVFGSGAVAAAVALVVTTADPDTVAADSSHRPALLDERAIAVLRWWDAERADAYARGDVDALRALYAPGAEVARSDVAVLDSYTARGLLVHGLAFEVVAAVVVEESAAHLVVEVEDRLLRARVLSTEGEVVATLPGRGLAERTLTFERDAARWRIADITESTS